MEVYQLVLILLLSIVLIVVSIRLSLWRQRFVIGFLGNNPNPPIIQTTIIHCNSLRNIENVSPSSSIILTRESSTSPMFQPRFADDSNHPQSQIARDCARMISFFPIDSVTGFNYHGFWESYGIPSTRHAITKFLITRCIDRWNELLISNGKYTGNETLNNNLIVLELESIITRHYKLDIESIDNNINILRQYNENALVFNAISDNLVYYRNDLMPFLNLNQKGFDFGIYTVGDERINKFNAVVMELYYNWIVLVSNYDYLNQATNHINKMLTFKCVDQTSERYPQKAVNKLMDMMGVGRFSYDRIIIIDDESTKSWMPISKVWVCQKHLWFQLEFDRKRTEIIPIIATTNWTVSEWNEISDLIDKHTLHSDIFLNALTEFVERIDTYCKTSPKTSSLLAQWISIDNIDNDIYMFDTY